MKYLFFHLRKLLSREQKLKFVGIFALMLVGASLESMGIAFIVPLVKKLLDNDFNIIPILIFLMAIFVVKNVFLFLEYYIQQDFVRKERIKLQKMLMSTILYRPYEYFIMSSTGEVLRSIIDDAQCTFSLISSFLRLLTELVVALALVTVLMFINVRMTIFVGFALFLQACFLHYVLKPWMQQLGQESWKQRAKTNNWVIQAVSGIKDVTIAHKQEYFINNFENSSGKLADIEKKQYVIGEVPKLVIESVTFVIMLLLITIMALRGGNIATLLPYFSACILVAIRLLPATNRILVNVNLIHYYLPYLNSLLKTLEQLPNCRPRSAWFKQGKTNITVSNQVELRNVTYAYPNTSHNILEEASMIIPIGKAVGIVGASGNGKTTSVDVLLGLLLPQSGEILADGVNIEEDYCGWLSHVAYVSQFVYMLNASIAENVALGEDKEGRDERKIWEALDEASLGDFVRSLPEGLETKIGERGVRLSGGQRQRLGIARALYTDPEIIVMDEATSSLDTETESLIIEEINNLHGRKTLVIIAHRLTTIENCDLVYKMKNGKFELLRGQI